MNIGRNEKVVLDRDDVRARWFASPMRSPSATPRGIRSRSSGSTAAAPSSPRGCSRRSPSWSTPTSRSALDISFYRDDVGRRAARAGRQRHPARLPDRRRARSSSSTTSSSPGAPCARRSRRCSTTAARPRAARRARRPRPPRAADPPRLRRQEPADRAQRARQRARARGRRRRRDHDHAAPTRRRSYETPAVDRRSRPRRHRADRRARGLVRRGLRSRDQEGADAARPARGQPLLRGLDAHPSSFRARRQAPVRRRAELRRARLERGEGGVPARHGRHALGLRAGCARRPLAPTSARRRSSPAGPPPRSSTPATAPTSTRRRRCSTSTRSSSASARWRDAASGSSGTCCTRAWPARTSSPSPGWARR